MVIHNVGGTQTSGDYDGLTLRGRDEGTLHRAMVKALAQDGPVSKRGEVRGHARLREHVWVLVARMLVKMGYAKGVPADELEWSA